MLRYLGGRGLASAVSLAAVVFGIFLLVRLTGDPSSLYLHENATQAERDAFNERNGFNKPIVVQFGDYLGQVVQLDFGQSLLTGQPATEAVFRALPYTLKLAGITLTIVVVLAVLFGSYMAYRPNSLFDRAMSSLAVAAGSIPDFWFGLIVIMVFAVELGILPTSGSDSAAAYVLPVMTLFVRPFGVLLQVVRSAMLRALASPYVKFARGKGASELRVVFGHSLRNAAAPVLTVAGDLAIGLFNGSVIVETIFSWPGIGNLVVGAIQQRDFVVVQTAVVVLAVMIFTINLIIDLCYLALDPRVGQKDGI